MNNNEMNNNEVLKIAIAMHKEFDKLETNLGLDFDLIEHNWYYDGYSIKWNTDNNNIDLFNDDGNTYSVDVKYIRHEDDDFFLVYVDNQCGDTFFVLLLKENKIIEIEE